MVEQEDREKLISIVIPCYNSEKTIEKLVDLVGEEFEKLDGYRWEMVLVNDFSRDQTFNAIRRVCEKYSNVIGIDLSRNFGQHNAIMAGLHYVTGDFVMGMDDDMQTHPSQIRKFIDKINEGYDIVYGKYPQKKHSLFRNLGSKFNDWTVRKLIGKPKGLTACSFWICRKFVRDEIIKYHNFNAHIQGLFLRTTARITNVEVQHFEREVGTSNYTLKKLLNLWMGCLNFSTIPLHYVGIVGIISSLIGFVGFVFIIIYKLLHPEILAGWASIICTISFFSGIILLSLSIIGEYVGRILLCMNNMPQFVIREIIGQKDKDRNDA